MVSGEDDGVCVFFIQITCFLWAFRGVFLCCLLIYSYLCGEIFFADGCMYYIDATISYGDVSSFQVVGVCVGLICFYRLVSAD